MDWVEVDTDMGVSQHRGNSSSVTIQIFSLIPPHQNNKQAIQSSGFCLIR